MKFLVNRKDQSTEEGEDVRFLQLASSSVIF